MPNALTSTGLEVKTRAELIADFTTAFQTIYGADINLESDSPDGQMMNIFVQAVLDNSDLLVQIYNSFSPLNALGVVLDQRVAINGIQRQAGTYTTTNITIVTSQALNLYGLNQSIETVYTVADDAGTEWELLATQTIGAAGSYSYAFQAKEIGATLTTPNTITVPVTIVLGVSSINNPSTYTTLGINEETDQALKLRQQQSVSLASQGYFSSLLAALENVSGIISAFVHENTTDATDADGVPEHSIWVIVRGTYADADVAEVIYTKRNAGCGMFGSNSYVITQADGSPFTVYWDDVIAENLFIKFVATSLDGINPPNIAAIRSGLNALYVPGVNEQVNINDLATFAQQIDNNCLVTLSGFSRSIGGVYTNTLSPTANNYYFVISPSNIVITPIILSPATAIVATLGSQQLTPLGGRAPYVYSMLVNNSGGSVSVAGLYTAGALGSVLDTVRVTDNLGNTGDSVISVV